MAFKGSIAPGSAVEVRFSSDANNYVSADLIAGFGMPGSATNLARVTVRPGDSGDVIVRADTDGTLRIHVDLAGRRGDGRLEVHVDGVQRDTEKIRGDTWWFYTIKRGEEAHYAVHGQHRSGQ